jgi:pyruvate formate lyase activating enzyme
MNAVQIGGLASFTTIDYPGKLAAVLFFCGCPLRCAYCSNPHLLELKDGPYDPDKILEWLGSRAGKLEAVVFSGGEAMMQGDPIIEYMRKVKSLGFLIGLHTNGFYSLEKALEIVDWVGLDFKAAKGKYAALTGNDAAYDKMLGSLDLLVQSGKPFEVRVTCDPRFVSKDDLRGIAELCAERGVKSLAVQKYVPHFETPQDQTDAAERGQFFNDSELKSYINGLFPNTVWRE